MTRIINGVETIGHDHSGDYDDGGTFDAANLTSGSAGDGQVLTADGSGGAAWESLPSALVARAKSSSGQSVNHASIDIIDFATVVYDTHSAITTGASWKFTAPVTGYYVVTASLLFSASTAWAEGEQATLLMYYDGVLRSSTVHTGHGSTSQSVEMQFSDLVYIEATHYIDLRIYHDSGSARTLVNDGSYNWISIHRIIGNGTAGVIDASGWTPSGETWTYASADDPTFTFTISGDKTGKYSAGMRIKLTQTTVKYFIITKVAYGDPNTTITIYGGTDYDLANAAITDPYYSIVKAPIGFPLDPIVWTVSVSDTSDRVQTSPVQNTWYNLGSITISIPIGCWRIWYKVQGYVSDTSGTSNRGAVTLSTANNSESDTELSANFGNNTPTGNIDNNSTLFVEKHLNVASKTSYYLNGRTTNTSMYSVGFLGSTQPTLIKAICAYL